MLQPPPSMQPSGTITTNKHRTGPARDVHMAKVSRGEKEHALRAPVVRLDQVISPSATPTISAPTPAHAAPEPQRAHESVGLRAPARNALAQGSAGRPSACSAPTQSLVCSYHHPTVAKKWEGVALMRQGALCLSWHFLAFLGISWHVPWHPPVRALIRLTSLTHPIIFHCEWPRLHVQSLGRTCHARLKSAKSHHDASTTAS